MNETIKQALETDRLIDFTATGRKTGQPRRKEIAFHYLDGEVFIAGPPRPRDWLANLTANPEFTVHFKQSLQADMPATAIVVTDKAKRREVFTKMAERRGDRQPINVDEWVEGSPLVQIEFHS
jgi:deazaflavin-dependent oxidoreductase (nitroreductase family)